MMEQDRKQIAEGDNLLQQVLSKYLPYWPVLAGAVLLGVLAAWSYLQFTTPTYEATATLIIKDEKKGNEESRLVESFSQVLSKKIVENEIEVIQSRKLMHEVADSLNLFSMIFQKKLPMKYHSAWFSSPVTVRALQPEALETHLKIPIEFDIHKNEVVLDKKYRYPLNREVNTPFGKFEFVPNIHYKPDSGNGAFYLSVYRPQYLIPALQKQLKALPAGKLSSIVNLSYRDEIPERAEDILNGLIHAYRRSETEEKNILAKNTLAFVNERLQLVAKDLDSIQQQAELFRSGSNAVDISTQGQLFLQNVSINDQKLSDVNAQISVLSQAENFVKNGNNSETVIPSTLGTGDPVLTQLLTTLSSLELEYEKGKATIGENHPRLLEIKDQIDRLKPNILQNISSQQKSLQAMKNNISATNNVYNSMLKEVPQKERQLIDITREMQNKRNTYEFLLQKKEESEIAYASTVVNSKIVDFGKAGDKPVAPNKLLVYGAGIAGLMLMITGFLTLRELFTGKIMYRKEIELRTQVPVIGEISNGKTKSAIVAGRGSRSIMAEEFRKIRLSLSFLGIDESHNKILVTSLIPGDGKSFVASNLAVSLTLVGKKVVLVDMDLNQPSQEQIFDIGKSGGVTEFLQEQDDALRVREVQNYPGLYLVSPGNLPESPSDLLMSGKVRELMDHLSNNFDVVIVDTSPLTPVTDGYILTSLCDATLYVVRHQHTPQILVKRLDENNAVHTVHNPAIIFNGVKQRGFAASNYGYGYGYGHNYKYDKNKARNKQVVQS